MHSQNKQQQRNLGQPFQLNYQKNSNNNKQRKQFSAHITQQFIIRATIYIRK